MARSEHKASSPRWPRVLVAAVAIVLLLVGVRAAWRLDYVIAPIALVLATLLTVLILVFSTDLEELTWKWRNLLVTIKQRPPYGAEALGELAQDLSNEQKSLENAALEDADAEVGRLRKRLAELAAKAETAERNAYAAAEADRSRVRAVRALTHSADEVQAGLELRNAAFDVLARVAAERGWRIEGDARIEPAGSYGASRADFALHTDSGLVLIDTAPITGGGNTLHLHSVGVEFTKRWAGASKAFLVIPDAAFEGGEVIVPGGPGKGDVESERTRIVRISEFEEALTALL